MENAAHRVCAEHSTSVQICAAPGVPSESSTPKEPQLASVQTTRLSPDGDSLSEEETRNAQQLKHGQWMPNVQKTCPRRKKTAGQAQSMTVLYVPSGALADLSPIGPSLPREVGAHGTRSGRSAPRTALKGTQGSKPRPRRELQYVLCCAPLEATALQTHVTPWPMPRHGSGARGSIQSPLPTAGEPSQLHYCRGWQGTLEPLEQCPLSLCAHACQNLAQTQPTATTHM
jgi:hypothetical protein